MLQPTHCTLRLFPAMHIADQHWHTTGCQAVGRCCGEVLPRQRMPGVGVHQVHQPRAQPCALLAAQVVHIRIIQPVGILPGPRSNPCTGSDAGTCLYVQPCVMPPAKLPCRCTESLFWSECGQSAMRSAACSPGEQWVLKSPVTLRGIRLREGEPPAYEPVLQVCAAAGAGGCLVAGEQLLTCLQAHSPTLNSPRQATDRDQPCDSAEGAGQPHFSSTGTADMSYASTSGLMFRARQWCP